MASNGATKKAMDVAKPGKVPADASSKPIIVTHRPIVQDPMVKSDTEISDLLPVKESQEVKSSPTSGEKVIAPPDHTAETDTEKKPAETEDETVEAAKPEAAEPEGETDAEPEANKPPKASKPAQSDPDTTAKADTKKPSPSSEAAVVDAVLDQTEAGSKQKEDKEAEQEAAKLEHLQKLVEEKKYFVKTGQVARRRNNRIAFVFLVLLLIAIGLYLAVDAKVVKPGFDVPIHIIPN